MVLYIYIYTGEADLLIRQAPHLEKEDKEI